MTEREEMRMLAEKYWTDKGMVEFIKNLSYRIKDENVSRFVRDLKTKLNIN